MGEVASGHQATQQPKNLLGAVKTRDGERMTTATCHATLSHVALPQDGHLRMRCRSAHANGGMRLHHAGKCSVPESNVTEAPAASCSSCLCSQRGSAPWENYRIPGSPPELRDGIPGCLKSFFRASKSLPRSRGASFELKQKTPPDLPPLLLILRVY